MPDPASAVVVPLGSAKLPGDDGASWLVDAERALWIGDDGGGQTVIWSLSTRAPMERLSLEAALDKDSAVTVHPAGAQLVVMAGDALHILCAKTLRPQSVLRGHSAKINRVRLLDGERLVSFGRDAELIVWDLRRGVMLARHDRRGVSDVRATGGPDSRLVKPFGVHSGRSWRVGLHELPEGSPAIVSHSLGLPHRARAVSVTAVARPAHAEVVGGFVWRTSEALCVCLCLFTSAGRRVLWESVAENPNDKSLFLWVEAIAPDVVRVALSGVATIPRRHAVSLTTGHISPWPGEGLTGGGRHLTFDGRLFDLHQGAVIPWPDLQRGEERRGEDLSEDGRLALTRAGDTLMWWSCER